MFEKVEFSDGQHGTMPFPRRTFANQLVCFSNQHEQCKKLGPEICLPVYYEQLVLKPKMWMHKILNFLGVGWNETVLHHERLIEKGDISLSK